MVIHSYVSHGGFKVDKGRKGAGDGGSGNVDKKFLLLLQHERPRAGDDGAEPWDVPHSWDYQSYLTGRMMEALKNSFTL